MRRTAVVLTTAVLVIGVACTPVPPPGNVLAIAYTNIDGIDGYDQAGGDVLIAKLVDSNDDGVVSPGDTVVADRYPLDLDPTMGFGNFQKSPHEVAAVFVADSNGIWVADRNGAEYAFQVVSAILGAVDIYQEEFPGAGKTLLQEVDLADSIEVDTQSPSAPDTPVVRGAMDIGDDPFIDVDIFI